jgi:hypothetical protein
MHKPPKLTIRHLEPNFCHTVSSYHDSELGVRGTLDQTLLPLLFLNFAIDLRELFFDSHGLETLFVIVHEKEDKTHRVDVLFPSLTESVQKYTYNIWACRVSIQTPRICHHYLCLGVQHLLLALQPAFLYLQRPNSIPHRVIPGVIFHRTHDIRQICVIIGGFAILVEYCDTNGLSFDCRWKLGDDQFGSPLL